MQSNIFELLNRLKLIPKMGKISKQKLRAMLVSTLMNRFLLMQVAGYCLQKLKFDYFELTLNNLNAIFFTEGLK